VTDVPLNDPTKHDGEKARYDLLPAVPLHEVVEVFTFGAKKYSEYNYLGLEKARIFGALLRHVFAWWRGEANDDESGKSHLAHAACCVLMLRHQETHVIPTEEPSSLWSLLRPRKFEHWLSTIKTIRRSQ
jgi:Domain of unknown function (DUF5664)